MKMLLMLFFALYFLNDTPLKAMLQIDPTSGTVVKSDGTPADAHSVENVLGFTSGYKVDPKTSKVVKTDGTPADPAAVQELIDYNITNTIQNSVNALNLTYDSATGNVYDADGFQVVSPQLEIVDKAVENSLDTLLNYKPDTPVKDKKGNILMKGIEWGTVSIVGVFLAYYGAKGLRSLYSENWRELKKAAVEKALAKIKDKVQNSEKSKENLEKSKERFEEKKKKNKEIKEYEKRIGDLKFENRKNVLKEKAYSIQEKVANLIGAKEMANKSREEVTKLKQHQQENAVAIEKHVFEKSMHEQNHSVTPHSSKAEVHEVKLHLRATHI